MNKQAIISALTEKYNSFVYFISKLTVEEYLFSNKGKWTAGQQLSHIVLCVKPLVQVFSMDKTTIEKNFGRTDRQNGNYEVLLNNYKEKLKEGGKAPDRFVPETATTNQKEILSETLTNLIKELCLKIETFNDAELDSLQIPHPLLGNLTLREMLYNAIHHVEHHQNSVKENLTPVY